MSAREQVLIPGRHFFVTVGKLTFGELAKDSDGIALFY